MRISAGAIPTFGLDGKVAEVGTRHARVLKSQKCLENKAEVVICCRDNQIQGGGNTYREAIIMKRAPRM